MPKNIVVCCDGTGNEFEGDDNSNVVKLFSTLTIDSMQVGYYHPGVGTMGAPTAHGWIQKRWSQLMGLAFGAGLKANIGDAYRYLMATYDDGDTIYLFGFSRGAYTVRALASLLYMYGLLHRGNESLIPYVIRMFSKKSREKGAFHETLDVAHNFKATFSRAIAIHFIGVWDTVSSIGWITDPLVLPYTASNPAIHIARHAVSINERRCYFRDNLFAPAIPQQDIKQVWFIGVHSDVGGSYPESQSGLSKVTLQWMLYESAAAGLLIDRQKAEVVLGECPPPEDWMPRYVKPDPNAAMHNSLHGPWWLPEFFPHTYVDRRVKPPQQRWRIPLGRKRFIPHGSRIYQDARPRLGYWDDSFIEEPRVKYPPTSGGDGVN